MNIFEGPRKKKEMSVTVKQWYVGILAELNMLVLVAKLLYGNKQTCSYHKKMKIEVTYRLTFFRT